MALVSYIIPIYNCSAFVEKCAISLLEQDYPEIEYIFVDDCSTDDSIAKIGKTISLYPNRVANVRIVRHIRNMGSATARNTGLSVVSGQFVMFADGDDWIDANSVSTMVSAIENADADIAYCDYFETLNNNDRLVRQGFGNERETCLEAMLNGDMHGSTCNKIYRRSFLEEAGQSFLDGADLFEDVGWNLRLFAATDRIAYLPKAFYHYVQGNGQSIIKSMQNPNSRRMRSLQRVWNVDFACRYLQRCGLMKGRVLAAANEWKLMAKNDLLSNHRYSWKRWIVLFPEGDTSIRGSQKITRNYKILLLCLHNRLLWLYWFFALLSRIALCRK